MVGVHDDVDAAGHVPDGVLGFKVAVDPTDGPSWFRRSSP